jgi:hypothetical protein
MQSSSTSLLIEPDFSQDETIQVTFILRAGDICPLRRTRWPPAIRGISKLRKMSLPWWCSVGPGHSFQKWETNCKVPVPGLDLYCRLNPRGLQKYLSGEH